jgi:hypothetical protein
MTDRQRRALAARLRGESPVVTAFDGFPAAGAGDLTWAAQG